MSPTVNSPSAAPTRKVGFAATTPTPAVATQKSAPAAPTLYRALDVATAAACAGNRGIAIAAFEVATALAKNTGQAMKVVKAAHFCGYRPQVELALGRGISLATTRNEALRVQEGALELEAPDLARRANDRANELPVPINFSLIGLGTASTAGGCAVLASVGWFMMAGVHTSIWGNLAVGVPLMLLPAIGGIYLLGLGIAVIRNGLRGNPTSVHHVE